MRLINGGSTERFHALGRADVSGEDARVIINIFRGQPRSFPYSVTMMERHPLGSQSFSPLGGGAWLAVVAPDEGGKPGFAACFSWQRAHRASITGRNVWHHPLMAVGAVSDFLVVDRDGPGNNLEEGLLRRAFHHRQSLLN